MAPRLYEFVKAFKLRQSKRGLHISDFQVVAQMGIGVFVIIAIWQIAQLPIKTSITGILFARRAEAVTAPIT
jgi:hypothetical protein